MFNSIGRRALGVIAVTFAATACQTLNTKKDQGTVIGAASGAAVGGIIGHATGSTARGAIIGAAVGGAAGMIMVTRWTRRRRRFNRQSPAHR